MIRHPLLRLGPIFALALLPSALLAQGVPGLQPPRHSPAGDPNDPGILDAVLLHLGALNSRLPASHQVSDNSELLNIVGGVGGVKRKPAKGQPSATGAAIVEVRSPNRRLEDAVDALETAASNGSRPGMQSAALAAAGILFGSTQGEIFDGFAMLNHSRGAFLPDHLPGQDRMKRLRDTGLTATGPHGQLQRIWEVDVRLLWYDDEADGDTHLLLIPAQADDFDLLRVNYTIYSTERGDFVPGVLTDDARAPGSAPLPFKGFDASWVPVGAQTTTELTVEYPALGQLRGLQAWDWRARPWRSHFIQPVREIVNVHTGAAELDPRGRVLAELNAARGLGTIGAAAPERKILTVLEAVQAGASPAAVAAMLNNPAAGPLGTWRSWTRQLDDRLALPEEALAILALEGIFPDQPGPRPLGPYDLIVVYANHELRLLRVDDGPAGANSRPRPLPGAFAGDRLEVKLINLDATGHRFRVMEAGPPLHFDIKTCNYAPAGGHSLEIYSWKPWYGSPKEAELQWRAGWGFRPHVDVIEQFDVFPRPADRLELLPYSDGQGRLRSGWQYRPAERGGDFVFDPPAEWIGTPAEPSAGPLREASGAPGLLIGATTPGYGRARICDVTSFTIFPRS
ncbi:MAG: hypothetical protein H8E31_06610, partial [Planctomycetes bacterium]|nr:hypothetical protein [Planctomycetota bacterium]